MNRGELSAEFRTIFGRPADVAVRAPARVNLIGEHTDYNDGFVLPIAVNRQTVALAASRDDRVVNFASRQADGWVAVMLDEPIVPGQPAWANYPRGVTAGLIERGVKLIGCDVLFDSDIPLGGGLSSSASLEVAAATALLAVAGAAGTVPDQELAILCQKAEHEFAGAPCGIMDQTVTIMAQTGRALLLDCRTGQTRQIPFDNPGVIVLVADTQIRHDIADGGYGARREQCQAAARRLGVEMLRDVNVEMICRAQSSGVLEGKELMRTRHVVSEINRTLEAVEALSAGDYGAFGGLMYASHASLGDDFEVSCEELDAVVELARDCDGVFGARMTGGGFGGCAIILAETDKADSVSDAVATGFAGRFGRRCPIFATRACSGAGDV